jgi:prevent-host-death family protein
MPAWSLSCRHAFYRETNNIFGDALSKMTFWAARYSNFSYPWAGLLMAGYDWMGNMQLAIELTWINMWRSTRSDIQLISIDEAKANFLNLIDAVADGEEIVITKAGKPIARLIPMQPEGLVQIPRRFGQLKGKVRIADDFDAPLAW